MIQIGIYNTLKKCFSISSTKDNEMNIESLQPKKVQEKEEENKIQVHSSLLCNLVRQIQQIVIERTHKIRRKISKANSLFQFQFTHQMRWMLSVVFHCFSMVLVQLSIQVSSRNWFPTSLSISNSTATSPPSSTDTTAAGPTCRHSSSRATVSKPIRYMQFSDRQLMI